MGTKTPSKNSNIWISVILIAIGVLFLLQNFDILYLGNIWQFWPMIIIILGVNKLVQSNFRDYSSAGILIGIGLILQLTTLDILDWGDIINFWPVILIIIGGRLLLSFQRQTQTEPGAETNAITSDKADYKSENRIDIVALFGGREMRVQTQQFEGGNITTLFAGTEVRFTNSQLAPGRHTLDIVAMFGGVELYVPPDWNIMVKGLPIFGGFSDTRKKIAEQPSSTKDGVLVITGFAMFGGVEVKDL
ncbi:MAG: hypothetical protein D6748_09625 [Calditrichaeota bacterium]|nr:MAG: hypothetical protein D6748_09625 [Calditrichota bacterium]